MELESHWERIHQAKGDEVSWYQAEPTLALEMIRRVGLPIGAAVIDAGTGASRMAEALLNMQLHPTLIDISQAALDRVKARLGAQGAEVTTLCGDIRTLPLPESAFDLWHDRAVFHFLTEAGDRAAYMAQLRRALKSGGAVVFGTFALDGPEKCSALPVRRYDAAGLAAELGPGFQLEEEGRELHATPFGTTQAFTLARFRRLS
jgi:ubiquinone/menaquinone biosynthesis C-methylase UbiE